MQYKIRLPIKSHASSFFDIQRILEKYSPQMDQKFQYITFDEPTVDLEQLINLARSLSAFRFYIDEKEIKKSNLYHLEHVIFCENKDSCKGLCTHTALRSARGFRGFNIEKIIYLITTEMLYPEELSDLTTLAIVGRRQGWQVHHEEELKDIYHQNHEKLIIEVKRGLKYELDFCQIIDWEQIESKLKDIPEEIVVEKKKKVEEDQADFEIIVELKEEQMTILAQRIAKEISGVMRELFHEAGLLEKEE